MIYCSIHQVAEQLPQSPRFMRALQWLQRAVAGKDDTLQMLSSLEPGSSRRVEIEGDAIFANLMCYETTPECAKLESHRKYCDIQYIHRGTEGLAWAHLDDLEVLE
ncbi:YhcH/YjgK/YiaL family protein, partial [Limnochorda sp.]